MAKIKKNKASLSKQVLPVKLVLEMAGKEYISDGQTIDEAIGKLGLDYTHIKTKGTITIFKDGKKAEKLFYLRPLRMLFANKIRRAGWIHQLEDLIKQSVADKS